MGLIFGNRAVFSRGRLGGVALAGDLLLLALMGGGGGSFLQALAASKRLETRPVSINFFIDWGFVARAARFGKC